MSSVPRVLGWADFVEMARIVILLVFASVAYGIAHDMVTAHVCVEYFTVAHPRVIRSESPAALALVWGIIATWWAGLIAGLLIAPCARIGRWPKLDSIDLLRWIGILAVVMTTLAVAAFVVAYLLAKTEVIRLAPHLAERIDEARHVRFLAVGGAHLASYAAGAMGSLVLAAAVVWRRWRTQGASVVVASSGAPRR